MKGLLVKDLRILAKQKKFFFIALVVAVAFTFGSDDVSFAAMYIQLLLSMLTLTTVSYDEMNGGMLFLLSLPANRKTYVKEKYVFAFLNLMCAMVVSVVVCYVASMVKNGSFAFGDFVSVVMGVQLAMGLMLAVAIPLDFKFGAEKGRMVVTLAMALVAVVGIAGYKVLTDVLHIDIIGGLANFFGGVQSEALLNVILAGSIFVVLVLVLFCSYLISNRIMKKKEF